MTNQPCTACGWTLRFVPERDGWGCDRCHAFVPQGAPLPSPSASPWAPPGGSAAVAPIVESPYAPPGAHAPPASHAPPPPAASPYAPPPYGAPPPAPYTPQRYSPHVASGAMPYPPPHGVHAATGSNKRLWLVGAGAAALIVIVAIVALTRSSGGVGSRAELINQTFAALSAGDVDKLVKLVDPENLFDRVLDCSSSDDDELTPKQLEREFREKAERLADKVKGRKLEVVAVESKKIDRDFGDGRAYGGKDRSVIKKGDKVFDGCRAKETFRAHEVIVTVKETRPGKKAKKKRAKLELLEVDGDWYLVDAPRGRSSDDIPGLGEDDGDDDDAMLEKMREFKDAMCACRDQHCAKRVSDEMTKWGESAMKLPRKNTKVSPKLEEIAKQLGECMMKAMEN
jgi:hypothetical protein